MPDRVSSESSGESRRLARGGALSFVGSAFSATLGFVLTFVITRSLGASGAGITLQTISVFMIVLGIAKLGMDSVAIWLLPRLIVSEPWKIRRAIVSMTTGGLCGGVVFAALLVVGGPIVASGGDQDARAVGDAVSAVGWFIPAAALAVVALAMTRGLSSIRAYVTIGSIAMPGLRLGAVLLVAIVGGSAIALSLAWASAFPAILIAAAAVVVVQVRKLERQGSPAGFRKRDPALTVSITRYAVPRTISAGLEQSILWIDVILVGVIAGAAAAGIYGGASRFVAAGLIVDTALRAVVSTRFSAMLFEGKIEAVQSLYRTAASWLVLFSTPIYVILLVFAPVVLGWLGPGFDRGSVALAILCVGAIITFTAGNIHSVLLMSGRSGLAATNKAIALATNIAGNLLLVPVFGMEGAAISWAVSMLLDAVLAAIQVRRTVGIRINIMAIAYAVLVPITSVGLPAIAFRLLLGADEFALVLSILVGGAALVAWCMIDRRRLNLEELVGHFRRSRD